eukprot:1764843-Rhodomonas_salina.2
MQGLVGWMWQGVQEVRERQASQLRSGAAEAWVSLGVCAGQLEGSWTRLLCRARLLSRSRLMSRSLLTDVLAVAATRRWTGPPPRTPRWPSFSNPRAAFPPSATGVCTEARASAV